MFPIFVFKIYSIRYDTVSYIEKIKRLEHVLHFIQHQIISIESNFSIFKCLGLQKMEVISENDLCYFNVLNKKRFKEQKVKALLIAPEYFLSISKLDNIITKSEKLELEKKLHELSEKYKNILMILGSLASERQSDNNDKRITNTLSLKEIMDQYTLYVKEKKARGIYLYKSVYEYYKSVTSQTNINKTKDYFNYLVQNHFDMYAIRGKEGFSQRVNHFSNNHNQYKLISNKTIGYLSGERILKYNKVAGYDEEKNYQNQMFVPGSMKQKLYDKNLTLNKIPILNDIFFTLGIEICFDHANGVAKKFWSEAPHIHLILSAAVKNHTQNFYVRQNGFLLHASTMDSEDKILQLKNMNFKEIDEIENKLAFRNINYRIKSSLIFLKI